MCGIAGIFAKTASVGEQLGGHLARMLEQLGERGPDSAGVAIYRDPAPPGCAKLSLHAPAGADWERLTERMDEAAEVRDVKIVGERHAVVVVGSEDEDALRALAELAPELHVMSTGREMEIYKEAIRPADFVASFPLHELSGSHALGHTRMATESRVTTDGSHPFSTGLDLCLVHNGSLSNHNRLRERLRGEGIAFRTDNDSEVAAGYLTWRLGEGASLTAALEGCLEDLDGFYTFAVGTADGFAVLRDPIACKPAVMAETDEWVAIASEYRALAVLPGAGEAEQWEPAPAQIYSWSRAAHRPAGASTGSDER